MRDAAKNLAKKYRFPVKSLDKWEESCVKSKKPLCDIFGLSEENKYRLLLDIPGTSLLGAFLESGYSIREYIMHYLHGELKYTVDKIDFFGNNLSYHYHHVKEDGSKVIKKWEGKLSKILTKMPDSDTFYQIKKKMNASGYFDHPITHQNWVTDLFSLNKEMKAFISANPEDFLINSNLEWSNCYRLNGTHAYRNSGIGLGLSHNTLICGVIESPRRLEDDKYVDKKYIGRFWVYILFQEDLFTADPKETAPIIAIQKNYGSIPSDHKAVIEEALKNRIAAFYSLEPKDWVLSSSASNLEGVEYPSHIYFDQGNIRIYKYKPSKYSQSAYRLNLKKAMCLHCGATKIESIHDSGLCRKCAQSPYRCNCCNTIMEEASEWKEVPDGRVCLDCIKTRYFTCEDCGTLTRDDRIHTVGDKNEKKICHNCIRGKYIQCNECGKFHPKTEVIKTKEGQHYCKKCAPRETIFCTECQQYHLRTNGINIPNLKKTVCKSCLSSKFYMCEECGQYEFINKVSLVRYSLMCRSCAVKNSDKVMCKFCGELHEKNGGKVIESHNNKEAACIRCFEKAIHEKKIRRCVCCNDYVYGDKECGCKQMILPIFDFLLEETRG